MSRTCNALSIRKHTQPPCISKTVLWGGNYRGVGSNSDQSQDFQPIGAERAYRYTTIHVAGHERVTRIGFPQMEPQKPSPSAAKRLKALRESLGLTTREVEEKSKKVASDRGNEEYYISHAWVTDIENGEYTPSIYKFYTFSAVYHRRYDTIVALFGLSMSDLKRYQASLGIPNTHLLASDSDTDVEKISLPVRLKVGLLELKLLLETHGEGDLFHVRVGIACEEMRVGDAKRSLITLQITHAQPEECNDRVITSMVNRAEGVKFVYAWRVFAVFDVRHPGMGNVILLIVSVPRDLLVFLFHFARGQSKALSQCL